MSKKLLKSTFIVACMTFLSRVLGLVREVIFTRYFGASAQMDAFIVAFKIPNFMRRLFAEGAFSQAFVPILSEYKAKHDIQTRNDLLRHVGGTLGGIVLAVSAMGMVASSLFVLVFAPGFINHPAKFDLASQMLRITFPYIFFISMTAYAGGILNCFERFAVPAFTPVLLNLVLISAAIWGSQYVSQPIVMVAWGVFFAGFVQMLFQIPFLKRIDALAMPRWGWRHPGVKRIIKLMIPALFGASVAQISLLMDTLFVSFLPTGSLSWLYFPDRLMQFPLGVFGVALATVVLPHLSRQHATQSSQEYVDSLDWALRLVLLFALPAAVALFVLSKPLIFTLYQYDQFTVFDVQMSQQSLMAYALGLFFFIMVKVLVSAFYAKQDMKTPVKVGIVALLLNILLNFCLIFPLAHAGLALATSLSSFMNGALLFVILYKKQYFKLQSGWFIFALRVIVATIVMAVVLKLFLTYYPNWVKWGGLERTLHLFMVVFLGVIVYFSSLWLFGIRKRHIVKSA